MQLLACDLPRKERARARLRRRVATVAALASLLFLLRSAPDTVSPPLAATSTDIVTEQAAVTMFTYGNAAHMAKHRAPNRLKMLYAKRHGHKWREMEIDEDWMSGHGFDWSDMEGRLSALARLAFKTHKFNFAKIWVCAHILEEFVDDGEWAFYSDGDTVIMNSDILLQSFIEAGGHRDLIMVDRVFSINNGAFFLRKSAWTMRFLERWQRNSLMFPQGYYFDQRTMMLSILQEFGGDGYECRCCEASWKAKMGSVEHECTIAEFDRLGFAFKRRIADHIALVDPAAGFNNLGVNSSSVRLREEAFHEGMFILHTKKFDRKSAESLARNSWEGRLRLPP